MHIDKPSLGVLFKNLQQGNKVNKQEDEIQLAETLHSLNEEKTECYVQRGSIFLLNLLSLLVAFSTRSPVLMNM